MRFPKQHGLVAQLDRVFDYESKGRRFESCRARVKNAGIFKVSAFFLYVKAVGCMHKHHFVHSFE